MARAGAYHVLQEGSAPPRGRFVALAPGAQVTCLNVDLPARVPAQARPAIARRQLEDRLALEQTELFPLQGSAPWTQVLAVDEKTAAAWRAALAPYSARCAGLIPDYMALPEPSAGFGTLWLVPRTQKPGTQKPDTQGPETEPHATQDTAPEILVRLSPTQGFRAEWDLALAALTLHKTLPAELHVHGLLTAEQHAALTALPSKIIHSASQPPDLTTLRPPRTALRVDLLEDEAAQIHHMTRSLKRWLLPVALIGLAAATWAAALWNDVQRSAEHLALLRETNTQTVRQYFVPAGPLLDLRAQVSQVTARSSPSAAADPQNAAERPRDPMPLLQTLAAGLAETQAEVAQILYSAQDAGAAQGGRGERGAALTVSVQLHTPGFAQLDALLAGLETRGLAVTVTQSAADPAGGVQARLEVRGQGDLP